MTDLEISLDLVREESFGVCYIHDDGWFLLGKVLHHYKQTAVPEGLKMVQMDNGAESLGPQDSTAMNLEFQDKTLEFLSQSPLG